MILLDKTYDRCELNALRNNPLKLYKLPKLSPKK